MTFAFGVLLYKIGVNSLPILEAEHGEAQPASSQAKPQPAVAAEMQSNAA